MKNKIARGQFFTQKNIFNLPVFTSWWNDIPMESKKVVLEPFAGANNIIKSLQELNLISEYSSYDIEPKEASVIKKDTLKSFPKGYGCVITNPPYLSKNSATKKKLKINFKNNFDLYELALSKCLENVGYVAAIIPESFITTDRFKDRVHSIISLTYSDMFIDTEHPVCLVLFNPNKTLDFNVYRNEHLIGSIKQLELIKDNLITNDILNTEIKFNDPTGEINLLAVDNNIDDKGIYFTTKNVVNKEDIKVSSRAKTRVVIKINGVIVKDVKVLKKVVEKANLILNEYRNKTEDVFMTSFKGLRKDGLYRRRLDFNTAKKILNTAIKLAV